MSSITPDLAEAFGTARALDCPLCPALAGDECIYSTAPVSMPVVPGTPVRPARGHRTLWHPQTWREVTDNPLDEI